MHGGSTAPIAADRRRIAAVLVPGRRFVSSRTSPQPPTLAGEELDEDERVQVELLESVLGAARAGDWRAASWYLSRRWPERYGVRS